MNKIRISLTEKDGITKGSIKMEGSTSFIQSSIAEVIHHTAISNGVTCERILQDLWHVILKEGYES